LYHVQKGAEVRQKIKRMRKRHPKKNRMYFRMRRIIPR